MGEALLLADIGGTNARFALGVRRQDGSLEIAAQSAWLTSLYEDLGPALEAFLEQEGRPSLKGAAVCAAGPVLGVGEEEHIRLTNCPWNVSRSGISQVTGLSRIALLNDFTAQAMALPELRADDLEQIGGEAPLANATKGVLGPGTGLGVSGLVHGGGDRWMALSGEGGHVDLAPSNQRELSVLFQLMQEFGHVSAERVLCGPGLETLYMAIGALSGDKEVGRPSAMEIANRAKAGTSALAAETVEVFTGWLGAVAGDLALTLGAKGGIYLTGGILPRWGALFDRKLFRYRFEAKGRFKAYLQPVPVYLITRANPALLGLARAAEQGSFS